MFILWSDLDLWFQHDVVHGMFCSRYGVPMFAHGLCLICAIGCSIHVGYLAQVVLCADLCSMMVLVCVELGIDCESWSTTDWSMILCSTGMNHVLT